MRKIIARVGMFNSMSTVNVVDEEKLLSTVQVPLEDLVGGIKAAQARFNADKIVLAGNKEFLSRYAAELNTNFNNNIEIEIKGV